MEGGSFVLQIKNYQIISSAKMEFIPGLNVIVGESNNGKSAVFRAVETAIFNLPRADHVKLGETKSAVGIRYDGNEVIWRRDLGAASPVSYRLNGKVLTKLGRGQPLVVSQALGIREVELDDTKMRLNFQKQMSYPFLLDRTPSQMFKFIVQSAEEDNLMGVIDTMKTDLNASSVKIKQLESSRDTLRQSAQREIQKYNEKKPCVPYCDKVLGLDPKVKRYARLKDLVEGYERYAETERQVSESLESIGQVLTVINLAIDKVRDKVDRVGKLGPKVSEAEERSREVQRVQERVSTLSSQLSLYTGIDDYVVKLQGLSEVERRKEALSKLLKTIENTGNFLNSILERHQNVSSAVDLLRTVTGKVETVLSKKRGLEVLIGDLDTKAKTVKSLVDQYERAVSELEDIVSEIEGFGVCPFCNSKIGGSSHEC